MIVLNYNFLFLLYVILITLPFLCQFNNILTKFPFAFNSQHNINKLKKADEKETINYSIIDCKSNNSKQAFKITNYLSI